MKPTEPDLTAQIAEHRQRKRTAAFVAACTAAITETAQLLNRRATKGIRTIVTEANADSYLVEILLEGIAPSWAVNVHAQRSNNHEWQVALCSAGPSAAPHLEITARGPSLDRLARWAVRAFLTAVLTP